MDVVRGLEQAGLSGNEATTYYELLRRQPLPAKEIAQIVGIDRSQMYTVLDRLAEKGLVQEVQQENRKVFDASSPENLLNPIRERASFIESLLPELEDVERARSVENEITVLDGRHGLRTFVRRYLQKGEAEFLGATGATYDYLYESPRLVEEVEDIGFTARAIAYPDKRDHSMTSVDTLSFRYLDIDFDTTTSILDAGIAFHYIAEEPQIIIVQNDLIATTYQRLFSFLWNVAEP